MWEDVCECASAETKCHEGAEARPGSWPWGSRLLPVRKELFPVGIAVLPEPSKRTGINLKVGSETSAKALAKLKSGVGIGRLR